MSGGSSDVVIVGAGVAGAALATVLARRGVRVALVDRAASCAPCFKAEKIEPDQADRLRELGLFDDVRSVFTPIRSVASAWRGRVLQRVELEQYGLDYWELANALRAQLPEAVTMHVQRVGAVEPDRERPCVRLADGSALEGRLVVLACGVAPTLVRSLGIERRVIRDGHSMAFGFDVDLERPPREFDSLTCYADRVSSRLDYVTLFPIGSRWRANLFGYVGPRDPATRALSRTPDEALREYFPRLSRQVGRCTATSRVEAQVIDLYTVPGPVRDGLLLVGDAHQSVCPATGTGLSKVLTDVLVAAERIPRWLETPGMVASKLRDYYEDARKRSCDEQSLTWAEHRRNISTRTSLRWRIHRLRTYLAMAWGGGEGDTGADGMM